VPVAAAANSLRDFLFAAVYHRDSTLIEARRAQDLIRFLWRYYIRDPDALPNDFSPRGDPHERRVADYIAGMTDDFATRTAAELGFNRLGEIAVR
jgi:dGTPase